MLSKRKFVLAIFLIVLLVALLNLQQNRPLFHSPHTTLLDAFLVYVYSPAQKGWLYATDSVKRGWSDYIWLVRVKDQNERFKKSLAVSQLEILSLKERLRIDSFDGTLHDRLKAIGLDGISARITAHDPYARSQTIWVSAGSAQGVEVDQPVMSLQGLVGRVIKVFGQSSQVLLLADPHFAVDVIEVSSRVRAVVVGSGKQVEVERYPLLSHVEFFNRGIELKGGELLITSGLGGIYPQGIPVGRIISDKKKKEFVSGEAPSLLVSPAVDFSKLEMVMILTKGEEGEKVEGGRGKGEGERRKKG